MNELAVAALGQTGLGVAVPVAELRRSCASWWPRVLFGTARPWPFARHVDQVEAPRSGGPDLAGWECTTSNFHLDDVVPVHVESLWDGEPVISEADQVLMLRHGLGFALEVVRLVRELPEPVAVRCVDGANSTNGTFRFDRARRGESWLNPDGDAYPLDKLIVAGSGPPSLGGTPW